MVKYLNKIQILHVFSYLKSFLCHLFLWTFLSLLPSFFLCPPFRVFYNFLTVPRGCFAPITRLSLFLSSPFPFPSFLSYFFRSTPLFFLSFLFLLSLSLSPSLSLPLSPCRFCSLSPSLSRSLPADFGAVTAAMPHRSPRACQLYLIISGHQQTNDGRLATFTNSPQVYKLAPLQSRHINANLPQIHTRPTFFV